MKPNITNGIFLNDRKAILSNNQLLATEFNKLPVFDPSAVFFLDVLGKGGFGVVQKAYDKIADEFIAIKKFKKIPEDDVEKKKFLEEIMVEDALLQNVEKIRVNTESCHQYFLKYDGVFREANDQMGLILKMESGCATLDNILQAGKVFSCAELLYAFQKIVEGIAKLEENGIANRDVKPQNIILVEDPNIEGRFFFKISDFGIGCQLAKNVQLVTSDSIKGITKEYAAPEVMKFDEGEGNSEPEAEYNPFLADVYSLGVLALKMINRSWGKKELNQGLLLEKEKFKEYEPILELFKGILEKDVEKRWDCKKILKFYQDNETDPKFSIKIPTDLADYYHKWQTELKEKKKKRS